MPLTAGLLVAFVTSVGVLWIRRDCWFSPWERAANLTIVLQIIALLLLVPEGKEPVCTDLYLATDFGWLDDFAGHCLYIWSAWAIAYHFATRLSGVAPRMKRLAMISIAPLTAARLALVASGHLTLYWVAVCATGIGLLLWSCSVMAELWAEPKHRRTIAAYVFASVIGIVTAIAQTSWAVEGHASIEVTPLVWAGCCLATVGFAAGFGYSWVRRKHAFRPAALVG